MKINAFKTILSTMDLKNVWGCTLRLHGRSAPRQICSTVFSFIVAFHCVILAQWLAWPLATGEVPGSNPGKGDNLII